MVALGGAGVAGLVVFIAFGLMYVAVRVLARVEAREAARDRVVELDPSLLYPDLTVKEARRMLAEWEAMSDEQRAALPDERRARLQRIQEDLAGRPDEVDLLRPDESIVLDVEPGRDGRIVVGIEETADVVAIPPCCVRCLGDPTLRVPIPGASWLKFPYCDPCASTADAVKLALSEGGTIRLAFARPEYAQLFVEMNGPPPAEA